MAGILVLFIVNGLLYYSAGIEIEIESPAFIEPCPDNCTLRADLPCSMSVYQLCPMDSGPTGELGPGAPDLFYEMVYDYIIKDNTCVAQLFFNWTVPNDVSGSMVRGFHLAVFSLNGESAGRSICLVYDLTKANFTQNIVKRQPEYGTTCIQVLPGSYWTILYSLPKPDMDDVDKNKQMNFDVPWRVIEDGKCVPPRTTAKPQVLPTEKAGEPATNDKTKLNIYEWLGIGIGCALSVVIIVMVTFLVKRVRGSAKQATHSGYQRGSCDSIIPYEDDGWCSVSRTMGSEDHLEVCPSCRNNELMPEHYDSARQYEQVPTDGAPQFEIVSPPITGYPHTVRAFVPPAPVSDVDTSSNISRIGEAVKKINGPSRTFLNTCVVHQPRSYFQHGYHNPDFASSIGDEVADLNSSEVNG